MRIAHVVHRGDMGRYTLSLNWIGRAERLRLALSDAMSNDDPPFASEHAPRVVRLPRRYNNLATVSSRLRDVMRGTVKNFSH